MERKEIPMNEPIKNRTKEHRDTRPCDKLPIIEVFTSIQGEGHYVGEPSLFIRVSGCNLRCCFKNSICDTPYSSFNAEHGCCMLDEIFNELADHPNVRSIVITGGEPMLYKEAVEDLIEYIEMVMGDDYFVTVETNGTIPPCDNTLVDMYSISPKLSTSVPVVGKEYKDAQGNVYTFTEERVNHLNETRYNPEATAALMDASDFQLKFVYSGPDSITSIDEFLNDVRKCGGQYEDGDIMLMPEGTTNDMITSNAQEAVKVCIDRGWILADRLHIRIWGDKRGV